MQRERDAAIDAVRHAATLTRAVQSQLAPDALQKKDKSPVTVADFGAQALVCRVLAAAFPDDPVVGEEDAADLAGPTQAAFRAAVVEHVSGVLGDETAVTEADVLRWIDRGRGSPAARFWTIDPVDGTKGFLRGQHYAVALALIEDGNVRVAALGCPNLALPGQSDTAGGSLFVAVAGQGTQVLPLSGDETQGEAVGVSATAETSAMRLVESVESGHSDHGVSSQLAAALGMTRDAVRIDSQVKYAVVAQGGAEVYLRLPKAGYVEKIWDHAAGSLVISEAGGRVTDASGRPLDFSRGALLSGNVGVVATHGPAHEKILAELGTLLAKG